MSDHAPYEPAGMPFTGIATFARAPHSRDFMAERPHFAVIGVPFDAAVGFRPGQRLAPRAIRDLSTRFALPWGPDNPGFWDAERDVYRLQGAHVVDAGDIDLLYFDTERLDRLTADIVADIRRAGAVPVALGGDHSVSYPVLQGFADMAPRSLHIVQLDAHLDFTDEIAGFARSNSSPFRRAAALPHVGPITTLGLRGLRANREAFAAARARGHRLVFQADITRDIETALAALPQGQLVYVSIDIDALDPGIAPGTSSPEFAGMTFAESRAILHAVAQRNTVVGIDLVEINPYLDPGGLTSLLGARLLLELMGEVHAAAQDR